MGRNFPPAGGNATCIERQKCQLVHNWNAVERVLLYSGNTCNCNITGV